MRNDVDISLVECCLSGDRRAFDALVEFYDKKLYNVAYRLVDDTEDAMDATQSAFVKAYEKLHTFDSSYRFFSWMYKIVVNESLTLLSKRRRVEQLEGDIKLKAKDPEETYSDNETAKHLQDALQALKPEYRTVVTLKHFQGLTCQEISEIVGVPEKTVKSRLFTARRRLKGILSKRGVRI